MDGRGLGFGVVSGAVAGRGVAWVRALLGVLLVGVLVVLGGGGSASAAALWSWVPSSFACDATGTGSPNSCIGGTGFDPNVSTWGQTVDSKGNCTNYAAFRLSRNGAVRLAGSGDAKTWKDRVVAQFGAAAVSSTGSVGSIAWWGEFDGRGTAGHVAYVEKVEGSTVWLTESVFGRGSRRIVLTPQSTDFRYPAAFLHLKDAPSVAPGAPTGVSARAGNASAVVSWVAPAGAGAAGVSGYTALSSPAGRSCATTGTLSCTVSGLANGTSYTFTVRARNAAGVGPASVASKPVVPRIPVSVSAVKAGYGNVLAVNIDPSRGVAAYSFRVQKRTSTGAWSTLPTVYTSQGTAETRSITLGAGVYRVYVAASGAYGKAYSAAVTLTPPTVRVRVGASTYRDALTVDVDPSLGSGYWSFRVQKRTSTGSWTTLSTTYSTQGTRETRTVPLPGGTYRVAVAGKSGYRGAVSSSVGLVAYPLYYVFSEGQLGCAMTGRYVKVVGGRYYQMDDWGCDRFLDRGTFSGTSVHLVGRETTCASGGAVVYRPSTLLTNGKPYDLQVLTTWHSRRVIGPTRSLAQLDSYFLQGNDNVDSRPSVAFKAADASNWTAVYC